MTRKYRRIIAAFYAAPWAILESKLDAIEEFLNLKAQGTDLTLEEIQARIAGDRNKPVARQAESVAVVPVFGVIAHRMDALTEISGGTSSERLAREIRALGADPGVSAIVLDVDSPGGTVSGMTELAAEIREVRKSKPVIAVANATMASAAYWLASAASEVVVTPSGMVGSIGVLSLHVDESGKNEKDGRKVTVFRSGPNKGSDLLPLSQEAAEERQAHVDAFAVQFRVDVAKGRDISIATVKESFGEGRMFSAKEAVSLGMADRVDTLDDVLAGVVTGQWVSPRAAHQPERLAATQPMPQIEMTPAASGAEPVAGEDAALNEIDAADAHQRRVRARLLELSNA
jgi:signal peptide peptidase SppA